MKNKYYLEAVKCPECGIAQEAKVEELVPFNNYTHQCSYCNYIIMESEWETQHGGKKVDELLSYSQYEVQEEKLIDAADIIDDGESTEYEKLLYSNADLQKIIKKTLEATSKGVLEFVNNENKIVDKFFKSEIPNAVLEITGTKNISQYINEELQKEGIIYNKNL